jgi:branched-chain amino acid transport system substrate-binding protein
MNHYAALVILLITLIAAAGCTGSPQGAAPSGTTGTVTIHALVPQTGALSSFGQSSVASLAVAEEDINQYYQSVGSPHRIAISVQDTGSDPDRALSQVTALQENGTDLVIGTFSSAQLEKVLPYANGKGILIVGTESTSPALAVPGDNLLRFTPDDASLVRAMPVFLASQGVRDLVPLWRGDVWGDTLENASRTSWASQGYTVHPGTRYDPKTADFSPVLSDLDIRVGDVIAKSGTDRTRVYAITMNEIAPILSGAGTYPNLTRVRWVGSDPNVLIPDISRDQKASAFAAAAQFTGPSIGVQRNAELGPVYQKIKSRLGREPEGAAVQLYDIVQVAALVSAETPSADISQMKKAFVTRADTFRGVSGDCLLNPAGDRAVAIYDFYRYTGTGNMSGWMPLSRYSIWPTTEIVAYQKLDAGGNVMEFG